MVPEIFIQLRIDFIMFGIILFVLANNILLMVYIFKYSYLAHIMDAGMLKLSFEMLSAITSGLHVQAYILCEDICILAPSIPTYLVSRTFKDLVCWNWSINKKSSPVLTFSIFQTAEYGNMTNLNALRGVKLQMFTNIFF